MTVVKFILDVKTPAEIAASTYVPSVKEPVWRSDGYLAFGDGVTVMSGLTFLPMFSGGQVDSISGISNRITVDSTDPANPVVDISSSYDTSVTNEIAAAVSGKEDTANKKTTMTGNTASNVFFLTAKAVYDWVMSLGFITNVVTALGYTPEDSSNKVTTLDNSASHYPSTSLLTSELAKHTIPYIHSVGGNSVNPTSGLIYVFGIPSVAPTTILTTTIRSIREVGVSKSGTITRASLSIRCSNLPSSQTSTWYIMNSTTNTLYTVSASITHVGVTYVGGGAVYNVTWVVTGLNIPVTAGDECQTVIQQPTWTTAPTSVYYNATYLINPS